MDKVYCLWPKIDQGIPIFLDAVLCEKFDPLNPMPPMNYSWSRNKPGIQSNFPEKLWLVTKDPLLSFDYLPSFSGFIVSKEMLNVIIENTIEKKYQVVPLETIGWKNKQVTKKEYFYLKFYIGENFVDYLSSEYVLQKNAKMEFVNKIGYGIDVFKKLQFVENITADNPFFVLNDVTYNTYIFCNELFKDKIHSTSLHGIDIIELENFVKLYNKRFKEF
jgi:Immunity protein 43